MENGFWILMYILARKGHLVFLFPPFFLFLFIYLKCLYFAHGQIVVGDLHYAASYSCSCCSDFSRVISNTTKNGMFQVSRVLPDIFSLPSIQSKEKHVHWYQPFLAAGLQKMGHQHPQSETALCVLHLLTRHDILWIFLVALRYWLLSL